MPYLERVYFIEGRPFAFVQGWLTPRAASVRKSDIKTQPIYGVLQHRLHITIAHADVAIRAARPPRLVADRLELGTAAALVMERSSYDEAGVCVASIRSSTYGPRITRSRSACAVRSRSVAPSRPAR